MLFPFSFCLHTYTYIQRLKRSHGFATLQLYLLGLRWRDDAISIILMLLKGKFYKSALLWYFLLHLLRFLLMLQLLLLVFIYKFFSLLLLLLFVFQLFLNDCGIFLQSLAAVVMISQDFFSSVFAILQREFQRDILITFICGWQREGEQGNGREKED